MNCPHLEQVCHCIFSVISSNASEDLVRCVLQATAALTLLSCVFLKISIWGSSSARAFVVPAGVQQLRQAFERIPGHYPLSCRNVAALLFSQVLVT